MTKHRAYIFTLRFECVLPEWDGSETDYAIQLKQCGQDGGNLPDDLRDALKKWLQMTAGEGVCVELLEKKCEVVQIAKGD